MATGSVREKNGYFYIRWRELDGTQHEQAVGRVGIREARRRAAAKQAEATGGEFTYSRKVTVASAWQEFVAQEYPNMKPGTRVSYDRAWDLYWKGCIGHERLVELDAATIQRHLMAFHGLAPSTRALLRAKLSGFLSWAVRTHRIPSNPVAGVTKPRAKKIYEPAISPGNWELLQECLPERYRVHFCVLYYTGIRIGELRALQWDDLRYGTKMWIGKTVYRYGEDALKETGKPFSTPKTAESNRWVHVPMFLHRMLKEWEESGWWRDCPNPYDLVFPTVYGNPMNEAHLITVLDEAVEVLRLHLADESVALTDPLPSRITIHSLRAGYARLMLANGMTITQLKHQLGHADIRTTMGYAREDWDNIAPQAIYNVQRSVGSLPSGAVQGRSSRKRGNVVGTS